MPSVLYIVVPCYKDEDTLIASVPVFLEKIGALIGAGKIAPASRLVLVNDGSPDRTWETILSLREKHKTRITAINLANNVGEQNALIAGMTYAAERADCVITMDSDLQDDINAVDQMLALYEDGKDIVLGVRSDRSKDGLFERICSGSFYYLMKIAKTGLVHEHANYRLLSKKAIGRLLLDLPENYYLPCVVSNLGMSSGIVTHVRTERIAGVSGYSLLKKLKLAKDALFAHSDFPLKIITFVAICSLIFSAGCLFVDLFSAEQSPSRDNITLFFCSLFFSVLFLILRIIGEYLFDLLSEIRRPEKYTIETILDD